MKPEEAIESFEKTMGVEIRRSGYKAAVLTSSRKKVWKIPNELKHSFAIIISPPNEEQSTGCPNITEEVRTHSCKIFEEPITERYN